jgi:hypothetical protein
MNDYDESGRVTMVAMKFDCESLTAARELFPFQRRSRAVGQTSVIHSAICAAAPAGPNANRQGNRKGGTAFYLPSLILQLIHDGNGMIPAGIPGRRLLIRIEKQPNESVTKKPRLAVRVSQIEGTEAIQYRNFSDQVPCGRSFGRQASRSDGEYSPAQAHTAARVHPACSALFRMPKK